MKRKRMLIFAAVAAVVVMIAYPELATIIIPAAVVGGLLYISRKKAKEEEALAAQQEAARKAEAEAKEAARKAEEEARELDIRAKAEQEEQQRLAKIKRFNDELDSIPQVDVAVSSPVPRQYLKDMPEYAFSSVTAKTRLSAIFPLVFIDVETTGLYPAQNEIVEVAAIKFDAGMIPCARFSALCKPKKPIPPEATRINNITNDMVKDAPNFREIAPALSAFLKGCNLAGHNLDFDMGFLHVHGVELPFDKRFYDTLSMAQSTIKKSYIWNHKLPTVCNWYGICRDDAHRALSDCYATSKIFTHLVFDKTSRMLDDGTDIVSDSDT